jgi:hypothetical protein
LQPVMPRYVGATPWGIRGNIPGAHYRHVTPEVDVEYRINSQGMRADRDYAFAKPTDTCRIAMFGDSFFMGYELDLPDTFAVQLEKELGHSGVPSEVLNFSVSGHGTAEMLRTYEAFARRFDPDLVIFEWHSTDFDDNVRSGLYRMAEGRLITAQATYLPSIRLQNLLMRSSLYRFIADHSQLYSFIRERLAIKVKKMLLMLRHAQSASHPQSDSSEEVDDEEAGGEARTRSTPARSIDLAGALLMRAAEVARAEGDKFLIVEVPDTRSRTVFSSTIGTLPAQVRAHLPIVSPLGKFQAAAGSETLLYYERGHHHLTPLGASILARLTAERIVALDFCGPASGVTGGANYR